MAGGNHKDKLGPFEMVFNLLSNIQELLKLTRKELCLLRRIDLPIFETNVTSEWEFQPWYLKVSVSIICNRKKQLSG